MRLGFDLTRIDCSLLPLNYCHFQPILKKFIDVVENLSQAATNGTSLSNGKELTARIQKWLKLQPLAVKRANQIGLTLENSFSVTQVSCFNIKLY